MNANKRPKGVESELILCWMCLSEHRAQRTWANGNSELVCPNHGPIITICVIDD